MSDTKHTPGPWVAIPPFENANHVWYVRTNGGLRGMDRAVVDLISDDETSEADAKLIAAAPEMLYALKQIMSGSQIADDAGSPSDEVCGQVVLSWGDVRRARAAIAKAEDRK